MTPTLTVILIIGLLLIFSIPIIYFEKKQEKKEEEKKKEQIEAERKELAELEKELQIFITNNLSNPYKYIHKYSPFLAVDQNFLYITSPKLNLSFLKDIDEQFSSAWLKLPHVKVIESCAWKDIIHISKSGIVLSSGKKFFVPITPENITIFEKLKEASIKRIINSETIPYSDLQEYTTFINKFKTEFATKKTFNFKVFKLSKYYTST